jgi:hypothetical protein
MDRISYLFINNGIFDDIGLFMPVPAIERVFELFKTIGLC